MFIFSHSKTAISFNILLILQILCRYKWHACRLTCLYLQISNVPTKLRKLTMGGNCPPPPHPVATLVHFSHCHNRFDTYLYHCSLCCICKFNAGCLNAYDYLLHANINDSKANDKTSTSRKSICESSLAKFFPFIRLKTPISINNHDILVGYFVTSISV